MLINSFQRNLLVKRLSHELFECKKIVIDFSIALSSL